MSRWIIVPSLLILAGLTTAAWANVPPPIRPDRPPVNPPVGLVNKAEVKLAIIVDNTVKTPTLRIPRNLLMQGGVRGPFGAADDATPTVVVGAVLALGFVSGGFWLIRKSSGRPWSLLLMGVSLIALTGGVLWADLAPFPRPRPRPPVLPPMRLPASVQLSGNLIIEIVPAGNQAILLVNRAMVQPPQPGAVPPPGAFPPPGAAPQPGAAPGLGSAPPE